MKRYKRLLILLAIIVTPFLLSACGTSQSSKGSGNKVTINFFNQKPEITAQYRKLIKMYTAAHPNVNIELTTAGQGGGAAALQSKFSSGEAPDIIMLGGLPDIDRYKDHLLTLKGMSSVKNILPRLISGGMTEQHRLVGIPVDLEAYGWVINKDVFRKAGVDPNSIHDYQQFVAAVKKINAQKDKLHLQGVFGFNGSDTNSITSMSAQFTSGYYKNDQVKAFESKKFPWTQEKRMKQYLDLIKLYGVKPILSVTYDESIQNLLFNGQVAMIPQGNWVIPTLDGLQKGWVQKNMGMLPYYVKDNGKDALMTGSSWYLGVTKDHPTHEKAAKDFINWMYNSKAAQDVIINEMRFVPATKNFDVDRMPDSISKEIYQIGTSKNAVTPIHKQYPNGFANEVIGPMVQRYFAGKTTWSNLKSVVSNQYRQLKTVQSGD